jgi:Na+-driven multidrug efflux pump
VLQGVMQGLGKQALAALYNLLAHWGIGMTIAYTTAITAGLGITGLWIGLLSAVSTTGRYCYACSHLM